MVKMTKRKNRLLRQVIAMLLCVAMCLGLMDGIPVFKEHVHATKEAQAASLRWPVPGHTHRNQGFHEGSAIDIGDGSVFGARVVAAIGGTVTYKWTCGKTHNVFNCCRGFGTGLVINGDDGRIYQYAHMQFGSIPNGINKGSRVNIGQTIGAVGSTGCSTGPHLHFGISRGNYWNYSGIDPDKESYVYTDSINYLGRCRHLAM